MHINTQDQYKKEPSVLCSWSEEKILSNQEVYYAKTDPAR